MAPQNDQEWMKIKYPVLIIACKVCAQSYSWFPIFHPFLTDHWQASKNLTHFAAAKTQILVDSLLLCWFEVPASLFSIVQG